MQRRVWTLAFHSMMEKTETVVRSMDAACTQCNYCSHVSFLGYERNYTTPKGTGGESSQSRGCSLTSFFVQSAGKALSLLSYNRLYCSYTATLWYRQLKCHRLTNSTAQVKHHGMPRSLVVFTSSPLSLSLCWWSDNDSLPYLSSKTLHILLLCFGALQTVPPSYF